MKNIIVAALAAAAVSSAAFAADLPRKDVAPAFPLEVDAYYEVQNIVTGSFTSNFEPGKYEDSTGLDYTLDYKFLDLQSGVAVGGSLVSSSTSSFEDYDVKRVEADFTWTTPDSFGFTTDVGAGVGYRFNEEDMYYQVNSGINYALNDAVSLNIVKYRFRNTFDNTWQSHEIGTGVSVNVVENVSVIGKIARSYDEDFNSSSDSATVGVSFKF